MKYLRDTPSDVSGASAELSAARGILIAAPIALLLWIPIVWGLVELL